jgi:polysaccharide pyruvyl transferase CsaB
MTEEKKKVKILMVAMSLDFGGAETHVMELVKELHRLGYDIHVASNGGVYADELIACGIPHYKIPLHTKRPFAMIKAYFMLSKLITNGKFDIVHCHARIPAFLCGMIHKNAGFRFVTTAHLDFKVNFFFRKTTNWGERTLAVSNDIKDYLIREYGEDSSTIDVTVNGVDMKRFSRDLDFAPLLKEFHLEKARRRVIYISRIDKDRSVPAFHLVSVAPQLRAAYPDVDFIIVGGGNDFDRLQQAANEANQKAALADPKHRLVTLTGPRSDINRFTAAADIFIGVSRSALEAMAAGCPVIVSGNQGYLGIFDETKLSCGVETNFCCRGCIPPSSEILMDDLKTLLGATKEELNMQGTYNRKIIAKYYSVSRMANDYLAFYDKLPPALVFRKSDIVISGYYGYGNSGDDTILLSIIQGLRRENPNIKIIALTRGPREMKDQFNVKCVNRFNPFGVYNAIRRTNLLLFGGGTLLQDSTSNQSLQYYLFIMRLAYINHKKLYIYANGIGPLKRSRNRQRVAKELSHAAVITVREPDSKNELIHLGVPASRVQVTTDPVFLFEENEDRFKILQERFLAPGKKYFAVSLRECKWLVASGFRSSLMESEIEKFLITIIEKHHMIPILIPMQSRNDDAICQRISEKVGSDVILADSLTTEDIISLIGGMELVIGMRLHSLIFAAKDGVPMIGLAYDPKVHGFSRYIDQEAYSFDLNDITAEKLTAAVDDVLNHYEEHVLSLRSVADQMKEKAENEIKNIVSLAVDDRR